MQHINLTSQLDRAITPPVAVVHQLWILGFTIILMLCFLAFSWLGNNSLSSQLKLLKVQQQSALSELEVAKAKKQKLLKDNTLKNEIEVLREEIQFRRQVLASVNPQEQARGGFAEHLTGLARQSIEGMWFTEILLQNGGSQLALLGRTQQAKYLPQYLQKLSMEAVFAGHQFRVFRMNTAVDKPDLLAFELRSVDLEQVNE